MPLLLPPGSARRRRRRRRRRDMQETLRHRTEELEILRHRTEQPQEITNVIRQEMRHDEMIALAKEVWWERNRRTLVYKIAKAVRRLVAQFDALARHRARPGALTPS